MSDQEHYQLSEREYRGWLNHHESTEVIGACCNAELCPIATYLSQKYGSPFQVTWEKDVKGAWYENMLTGIRHILPSWAKREAAFFDSIHGSMEYVTKGEYDQAQREFEHE